MIRFKVQGLYKYNETDPVHSPLPVDTGPLDT